MNEPNLKGTLVPDTHEARLERQWVAIRDRAPARRWLPAWSWALAVSVAAVLAAVVYMRWPRSITAEGSTWEVTDRGEQLTLPDGSTVELEGRTKLQVKTWRADEVRLDLLRGVARLNVVHSDKRAFVVQAGNVEVVVKGTQFRVARSETETVEVTVSEGAVEVRTQGAPAHRIAAGQRWPAVPAAVEPPEPPDAPEETDTPDEPAVLVAPPRVDLTRFSQLLHARKPQEAYASLGKGGFDRALQRAGAAQLLELADVARLTGRPKKAVAAFRALVVRYPDDARAGLAAYEMGRLDLDALGDPKAAVEALDLALKKAPTGPFAEDALARKVQALDELGDLTACQKTRDTYRRTWPKGIHSAALDRRCTE